MKQIDLTAFRPISTSLDCINALVDQSALDIEVDFAFDRTAVRSARGWTHAITDINGFKSKCYFAANASYLPFSILLKGKSVGYYLDDRDAYLIPFNASFEVLLRGVFTMHAEGWPIEFKGYAECLFKRIDWCDSSGGSLFIREAPLSAGAYFQNQAVDKPPPLYLDVFALQEREHGS